MIDQEQLADIYNLDDGNSLLTDISDDVELQEMYQKLGYDKWMVEEMDRLIKKF